MMNDFEWNDDEDLEKNFHDRSLLKKNRSRTEYGYVCKRKKVLHRADGPAVIMSNGSKYWYWHGEMHRKDAPAIETPDGTFEWFSHGLNHRENGPAISSRQVTKWCRNGFFHREDGPAFIFEDHSFIYMKISKHWYLNGLRHREDGPAFIGSGGEECWYFNGVLHRNDGPAVIGNGREEWWLHGARQERSE